MQAEEFNHILEEQLDRCRSMLGVKAEEYADDKDRLANFKKAAALKGETLELALGGMMAKHTVSVYDMIQSGEEYPRLVWDEKITDHINYLILLKAILVEKEKDRCTTGEENTASESMRAFTDVTLPPSAFPTRLG